MPGEPIDGGLAHFSLSAFPPASLGEAKGRWVMVGIQEARILTGP